MFNKNVDSIVSKLIKMVDRLDVVHAKLLEKRAKNMKLVDKYSECAEKNTDEANRAIRVAGKIREIVL